MFCQESDLQLVQHGFAIVDSWIDHLESKLKRYFIIVDRMENQLTVRLEEDQSIEDSIVSLLAEVDKAKCRLKECLMEA